MRDLFSGFTAVALLVVATLVAIGLTFLIWGIMLAINPETRFEGFLLMLIVVPDAIAICFVLFERPRWN